MRIPALPAFVAILTAVCLSAPAHAQLLFSTSGTTDYVPGESADAGNPANGGFYTMAGDVFTPTATGTAASMTFSGVYFNDLSGVSSTTDNFTLSLYSVNSSTGAPDTLLGTSTLNAIRTVDPNNPFPTFYNYTASLNTPVTLTAGTAYYLGISNATNSYANWEAAINQDPGYLQEYSYNATNSTFQSDNTAQVLFSLSEAPEPSSWIMLAAGLGLLVCLKLRKRLVSAAAKH